MDFSPRTDSWSADEVGLRASLVRRPPRPRRPDHPEGHRIRAAASFRRAFTVTVGVLILVCAGLVVVADSRGPTLSSTQVDTAAVTTTADQQLRLFANQSVSHIDSSQVTVTPRAPFTVETAATMVTVQFSGLLRSATPYEVSIRGVTSVFGSAATTFQTSFTTAHAQVLTLDREPGGQDRIVRASVNAAGRTIVYRAAHIQAFGAVGSDYVVVTEDRGVSSMGIVADDGTTEPLLLPGAGLVRAFALNPVTGIVSFTWTPASTPNGKPATFTLDLQGQGTAVAAPGAAGRRVLAAVTAPASRTTTRGMAQLAADDRSVALSTGAGSRPILLASALPGQRFSALRVSPNGQYVSVVSAVAGAASDGYTIDPAPVAPTTEVIDVVSGATVATFAGSSLAW
jgi:hypothetical protein